MFNDKKALAMVAKDARQLGKFLVAGSVTAGFFKGAVVADATLMALGGAGVAAWSVAFLVTWLGDTEA